MSAPLLGRAAFSAALTFAVGPEPSTPPPAATEAAPNEAAENAENADELTGSPEVTEGPRVTDAVLPCGLRVIAAHDGSLPVASVVLAVDVGTEDDPEDHPGLIHALAFHLQAGNRELQPGEALASAHDVGGLSTMAVGHAQVRFESVVPVSQLDRMLWIEAMRLRAPTVNETLWLKSLNYARADRRPKYPVPADVMAELWARPGLAHDGHAVPRELGKMLPEAVAAQLAKHFGYRRATLIVVSPREPEKVVEAARQLFADLPTVPRDVRGLATASPTNADAPRPVPTPGQKGDTLVWSVPPRPGARVWAEVVCATLNRQRRDPADGPKSRLRCTYIDDPRRPVIAVRAAGVDDPAALAAARLARIEAGREVDLVTAQRDRIRRRLRGQLHVPAELARHLAQVDPTAVPRGTSSRSLDALTGVAALDEPTSMATHVAHLFDPARAVLLVPAPNKAEPADEENAPEGEE